MRQINVREDGSEIVPYSSPDLPAITGFGALSTFPGLAAFPHWHRDFEAAAMLEGEMDYDVNGLAVHLQPGDGIFVNGGRLHSNYSADKKDCRYSIVVFHPDLLGMTPAVYHAAECAARDGMPDFLHLSARDENDAGLIGRIREMAGLSCEKDPLAVLSACAALLRDVSARFGGAAERPADPGWAAVRAMTGYVQAHYAEPIRLDDIAKAGGVSRSRCCVLFREKLRSSPALYVTRYRLDKACCMLREGCSVTEAAFATGFSSVSYFSETFRKAYAVTPTGYAGKRPR